MLKRLLLALAVIGIGWSAWLAIAGGVDTRLVGVRITSNEPMRPLIVAAIALAAFTWLYGAARVHARVRPLVAAVDARIAAVALALVVTVVAIAYSTTAAAASDSYGYVSEADQFLTGRLRIEQPWMMDAPWPMKGLAFAPLGYRPIDRDPQGAIVPTYSPGLPLLMAGAKRIAGQEGMFAVVPLMAGLLVLATFGIGRRLGMPRAGLVAAFLMATCPALTAMSVRPMSDVPGAAAWTGALYFALGGSGLDAIAAGLCTALAIVIRPNLAPCAAALLMWYAIRDDLTRRWKVQNAALYAIAAAPGVLVTALIYRMLYGSFVTSGYGRASDLFSTAHIWVNLKNYAGWAMATQTPFVLAGLVALFVRSDRLWPTPRARRFALVAAMFSTIVWVEYLAFMVFDDWLYLRLLLPAWPLMMLGVGAVAMALIAKRQPALTLATAGLLLWIGIFAWRVSARHGTFSVWADERRFVSVAALVRERTRDDAVVFSMLHSGTLRYYAGRRTARWDFVDPEWMDRAVAWVDSHGGHAYALLETWEIDLFRKQFAGQRVLQALETPSFIYEGSTSVRLYDLSSPRPFGTPPDVIVENFRDRRRSVPPAE